MLSWFNTELAPRLGSGMWLVPLVWTSLLALSSAKLVCHICLQLRQEALVLYSCILIKDICLHHLPGQIFFLTRCVEGRHQVLPTVWQSTYSSRKVCITSSNGNFVVANWFTSPMKVFMCTIMLSLSLYFSLTIFLIKEVLLRAFILSYKVEGLCHILWAFVLPATCWRMVATAFLIRSFHSDSNTHVGIFSLSTG